MTRRAQPLQNASLPCFASSATAAESAAGRRASPTAASSAGSSVIEASIEMQTTTIAPTAIERSALTSIAKSAASDTATAAPLKTTAVPELAHRALERLPPAWRPRAARAGSG